MTRIVVKELIWDQYNLEHIKKHKVIQDEVLEAVKNIISHERTKQGRYLIIGRVGSRMLTIIVIRKGIGTYYPVTARDAAKKERIKAYGKEKKEVA